MQITTTGTCRSLDVRTLHSVYPSHWPWINSLRPAELELMLRLKSCVCVTELPVVRLSLNTVFGLMRLKKQVLTQAASMWLQLARVGEQWRGRWQERNLIFRFQIESMEKDLQGSGFLLPLSLIPKCPPYPLTPDQMWKNITNIYTV